MSELHMGYLQRPSLILLTVLGLIQGTGHARLGWALTSSIMFDQMEPTHGAHFHSPQPAQTCHCTGKAFVDDSSRWLLKLGLALNTIIRYMQASDQKWERLLYATGGTLNHAKCFWYGIKWTFNDAGNRKMTNQPNTTESIIQLTAGNDMETYHTIQQMAMSKGIWTLGVQFAPDGNDNDEFDYWIQQAMLINQ